jgi:tripartite-type tricarboxylate transporter receptor subunit TctC
MNPAIHKLPYDPVKSLMPIAQIASGANVIATHPAFPAKTAKDLIALAKAKPGDMTYGTSGVASPEHFAGEMFKTMTKTNLLMVPYKGGGPLAIDLAAGQLMTSFSTMPPIIPHIRSGRVRAIAVTTEKRAAVLPDVPTVGETVPGYTITTWYGAVAPAKVPREIIVRLNQEMLKALQLPDIKERMASLGADIVGSGVDATTKFFASEVAKYTVVAREAKIQAE